MFELTWPAVAAGGGALAALTYAGRALCRAVHPQLLTGAVLVATGLTGLVWAAGSYAPPGPPEKLPAAQDARDRDMAEYDRQVAAWHARPKIDWRLFPLFIVQTVAGAGLFGYRWAAWLNVWPNQSALEGVEHLVNCQAQDIRALQEQVRTLVAGAAADAAARRV